MTLKQACYRLTLARKKAANAKEEIARLNKFIKQLGGHPDEKKRQRRNREIFRQFKKGESYSVIAKQVRLSATRVQQICRESEWKAKKKHSEKQVIKINQHEKIQSKSKAVKEKNSPVETGELLRDEKPQTLNPKPILKWKS